MVFMTSALLYSSFSISHDKSQNLRMCSSYGLDSSYCNFHSQKGSFYIDLSLSSSVFRGFAESCAKLTRLLLQ